VGRERARLGQSRSPVTVTVCIQRAIAPLANLWRKGPLDGSAPKVRNRFLKPDDYRGSLQVFRPFGDYVAFMLFLVYFVDEQEALATPHRSRERNQPAAGIHAECLGSFVERFAFHCPSVDQHRKIYPQAVTPSAFWKPVAVFGHYSVVSARRNRLFAFLQEVPNPAHVLPRSQSFVIHSIVTQAPSKGTVASYGMGAWEISATLNLANSCRQDPIAG